MQSGERFEPSKVLRYQDDMNVVFVFFFLLQICSNLLSALCEYLAKILDAGEL